MIYKKKGYIYWFSKWIYYFLGKQFDQSFTALPVVEKKRISLSKVHLCKF